MKREKPAKKQTAQAKEIDQLYQKLREQINKLGVSVRAIRSKPSPTLQKSAGIVVKTSAQIKKLIQQLPRQRNKS